MPALWAASIRHLLRHPAQLALALLGLSVGVATITAVDIATASSARAFSLSMRAVNGAATHDIVAAAGIDERVYVDLRKQTSAAAALSPVVEGYVGVGGRTMRLVGIDPFAAAELAAGGASAQQTAGSRASATQWLAQATADLKRWFTELGSVVMAPTTMREFGLTAGASFVLAAGGKQRTAVLLGPLSTDRVGTDALILTDIAQAQEWLDMRGRLSRIEVRVPEGAAGESILSRLRAQLPPGLQLEPAQSRTRESLGMTAAFDTNLRAMSLLALLVSTFLIYGAVSFAVVQRRRILGILRALGATRAQAIASVLAEAAVLGIVGSGLGLLLGISISHLLVRLVSQTINDLYFVVAVNQIVLPAITVGKACIAGIGSALAGALLPALEVAGGAPQLGLRRSVLEARAATITRHLLLASGALAAGSGLIVWLSDRSVFAGFLALFMLLLSVAALTPAVLRGLARVGARMAMNTSAIVRLALADIGASLSRTGVAVAALGLALAAMIGVSIMVASFRESLRAWLERSMRADIYITAPGPGAGRPERHIDSDLLRTLLEVQGIADYSVSRRLSIELAGGPVALDALQLPRGATVGLPLVAGEPAQTWPAFERGEIVVSEPLAWRLRLHVGEMLTLPTASGPQEVRIAGIYRDYGSDRGNLIMSLREYRRLWNDPAVTAVGLYLARGARLSQVMQELRRADRGAQGLLIRSNAQLRELSMSIFERTFIITRVLYWLAAGVAAIGLVSSLLAWELERSREMAILRSLGLTSLGGALLIEAQTGFMGLVALLAAIPAGVLTALLLIEVINRRAFGWQIDLHLAGVQFANALLLAVLAAVIAGVYPAWRNGRANLAGDIREE
ncbi:MAG TPA: FtsX-like permease family protein [Steroidobacteraceae bacterium]